MKLPSKIRSIIDEMGLKSPEKTKVLRHLNDMADSLPEHPTPAEAKRIVGGALKSLKITVGGDDDSSKEKDDEPKKKEKKEEPKEEKPKAEKKEKVEEAKKLSFKAFLSEAGEPLFQVKWKGYPGNPKPQKVGMDFFDEGNGFEEEDRDEIKALPIGGEHRTGGMHDSVTITRLK